MHRILALAALAALSLADQPAVAATTEQQKFEKKLARYAHPAGALDFTKPRGFCTCGPDDPVALPGQTGILSYDYQLGVGIVVPVVVCEIPAFDAAGAVVGTQPCSDWTRLSP